jgi:putative chitinase
MEADEMMDMPEPEFRRAVVDRLDKQDDAIASNTRITEKVAEDTAFIRSAWTEGITAVRFFCRLAAAWRFLMKQVIVPMGLPVRLLVLRRVPQVSGVAVGRLQIRDGPCMNLTPQIVSAGCGAPLLRANQWVQPLQGACDKYSIGTPLRVAAFLAQIGVESARLTAVVENLNYSAEGLLSNFPEHFTEAEAQQYANKPPMIANRVYANRMGNGDEASGDGWKYRGRGCIQLTGRDEYVLYEMSLELDLLNHPELLEQSGNAAMGSAWYWANRGLSVLADAGNFLGISKAINLGSATAAGTPGQYSQRLALYGAAKKALGIA